MKIALISDIHANEVALSAVLNDIKQVGVNEIVCLGDVATLGPRPNSVIRILRELKCKCIKGNHAEYAIVEADNGIMSVMLRRVKIDKDLLCDAITNSENPLRHILLKEYE